MTTPHDPDHLPFDSAERPMRHRRSTPLLRELDREWERLRRRPTTMNTLRTWTGDETFERFVRSALGLDDVVAATQPCGTTASVASDAVLRRLIVLAQTEPLAGRIVLQRILPGLISRAQRWRGPATTGDPTDIAIGAAWIAIRRFDTSRRRHHVAPALIADALWIGFRREARRMGALEVPVPETVMGTRAAPAASTDPVVALADALRAAERAGVRSTDIAVIKRIAAAGGPTRAATECRVTVRTIRNRRDVASRRIRHALGPDWAADWAEPLSAA